jgi:hypothetical protein
VKEGARLSAMVAKFGGEPERRSPHGRVLTAAEPQGLIEAVLEEIDETVLARELQFRNGRGEEVRLEVSGRRLLRVASVTPKELADTGGAAIGAMISDADGAASRGLAEVLWTMATDSPSFAVVSRKLSCRPDPAETGCSPEALRASWKRLDARPERARPPTIADLITRVSPYTIAFIRLEGGTVVQKQGEHQLLCQLVQLARIDAPGARRFPPGRGTENCVLLTAAIGGGDAILYVRDDRQVLLLMFPSRSTAALISHWSGNA